MSNWVQNQVALKGTKEQMTKLFNQVYDNVETWEDVENNIETWELTMRSWLPMPKTFEDFDTTNSIETFEMKYGELLKAAENLPVDEYEQVENGYRMAYQVYVKQYNAAKHYQEKTYGCVGWYDYNKKTLGTKWNAQIEHLHIASELEKDDVVVVYFYVQTAWTEPIPFLEHLAQFVHVVVRSDEEGGFFNNFRDINKDLEIKDIAKDTTTLYKKYKEENRDRDEDEWYDDYRAEEMELLNQLDDEFYQYVIDLQIS